MDSLNFNWDYLLVLLGALVPFITAIVKKVGTPDWQSGLMTLVFSALAATANLLGEGDFSEIWDNPEVFFSDVGQVWVVALTSWLGLTSDATSKVYQSTKGFLGVGADTNPASVPSTGYSGPAQGSDDPTGA